MSVSVRLMLLYLIFEIGWLLNIKILWCLPTKIKSINSDYIIFSNWLNSSIELFFECKIDNI